MTTAFDAMLALARKLNTVEEGEAYVASGGTTSTVVSSVLTQADDYWNGGTVFITYDAGGSSAAPQGQSREITDFAASSDTVTVSPVFTAAVASGDKFAICDDDYPRRVLLMVLNSALQWYGDIICEDDTSLDTAADTLEYALPAAAVNDLRQVYIARSTSSPYYYEPFPYWQVDYGSGYLVFRQQPNYTYNIRLVYHAPHDALTVDADTISSQVNLNAIYNFALAEALQWKQQMRGYDDRKAADWYNQFYQIAEKEKKNNPPRRAYKDPSYAIGTPVRSRPQVADPS